MNAAAWRYSASSAARVERDSLEALCRAADALRYGVPVLGVTAVGRRWPARRSTSCWPRAS